MAIAHRTGSPYVAYAASKASVAVTQNDLIVVFFSTGNAFDTGTACSDNASGGTNAYTQVCYKRQGAGVECFMWYAVAKATETLTITVAPDSADPGISIHVYSGCATTSVVEGTPISNGAASLGVPEAAGYETTVDTVIVAGFAEETSGSTQTAQNSFTKRTDQTDHVHCTIDYIISAGTYVAHVHGTYTTSCDWCWGVCAFKAAAGASLQCKTASTEGGLTAASYQNYVGEFTSLGWVKIKVLV